MNRKLRGRRLPGGSLLWKRVSLFPPIQVNVEFSESEKFYIGTSDLRKPKNRITFLNIRTLYASGMQLRKIKIKVFATGRIADLLLGYSDDTVLDSCNRTSATIEYAWRHLQCYHEVRLQEEVQRCAFCRTVAHKSTVNVNAKIATVTLWNCGMQNEIVIWDS